MYKSLQLKSVLIFCCLLVVSCGVPSSSEAPASSVAGTPVTDEEFDAAVKEAHGTLQTVRQALLAPKETYTFVGLKVRFIGQGVTEDMWTQPVDYYNGVFTIQMIEGVTINTGVHPESYIRATLDKVLDWMIVEEDGNLIGGYTIRLTYEHMTADEKAEFLKITGYKIE